MNLTPAAEDYLKTIYALATRDGAVTASAVAEALGVSAPSVSAMVKRLAAEGLVERAGGRRLALTDAGRMQALRIVRRHRLLETFLVTVLGLAWDEVHDEAESLEHAISDRLEQRIDAALGHPTHDPHGDPIPGRDGTHDESWADPLADAPPDSSFLVERVSDRDSAALRYLGQLGIRPGVELALGRREPFGGPLWVTVGGRTHALGAPLARLVHGTTVKADA